MDILFKPRVESTERMAQNCMDMSKWHAQSLYIVVISCFNFVERPKTQVEGS